MATDSHGIVDIANSNSESVNDSIRLRRSIKSNEYCSTRRLIENCRHDWFRWNHIILLCNGNQLEGRGRKGRATHLLHPSSDSYKLVSNCRNEDQHPHLDRQWLRPAERLGLNRGEEEERSTWYVVAWVRFVILNFVILSVELVFIVSEICWSVLVGIRYPGENGYK